MLINQIRFYHYISSVLVSQQADPLCGTCKALSNTVAAVRESLKALAKEHSYELGGLPKETSCLLEEARARICSIKTLDNAAGQKKAGNCKMPEGVCFVKTSKAILNKISEHSNP